MDIEQLKQAWQSQATQIERLEEQNKQLRKKICSNRITSTRSKLMRTYATLTIIGVVMIPFIMISFPHLGIQTILIVAMSACMGAMSLMNLYVYLFIRSIDLSTLSVREAIAQTIKLEVIRQRLRIIALIFSIPVVVWFLTSLYFQDENPGLYGGIIGGVIGGIIGLRKEFEIKRMIRVWRKNLEDTLSDD